MLSDWKGPWRKGNQHNAVQPSPTCRASLEEFHDWWHRMPLLPQVLRGAVHAVSVPNPGLDPQLKGDHIICFTQQQPGNPSTFPGKRSLETRWKRPKPTDPLRTIHPAFWGVTGVTLTYQMVLGSRFQPSKPTWPVVVQPLVFLFWRNSKCIRILYSPSNI